MKTKPLMLVIRKFGSKTSTLVYEDESSEETSEDFAKLIKRCGLVQLMAGTPIVEGKAKFGEFHQIWVAPVQSSYQPKNRAKAKEASREADAKALREGTKSAAELKAENSLFSQLGYVPKPLWDKAKPIK